MYEILIVEDDLPLAKTLKEYFTDSKYHITICIDGAQGYKQALQKTFDLIILDVILPQKNGLSIASSLRSSRVETPILMLTSQREINDICRGLDCGADAYLTKPFSIKELDSRIQRLLLRPPVTKKNKLEFGELTIDCERFLVKRNKRQIVLRKKEFEILAYMAQHAGTMLTRERILTAIWDNNKEPFVSTVDVHVSNIRRKLDGGFTKQYINTVHGMGFKFNP